MQKIMMLIFSLFIILISFVSFAATPDDTLIMAWQFDDIVSLDPAEISDFSGSEYIGNTYDRLISYDVHDINKLYGSVAEKWYVSEDGKTYTFTIRKGIAFASGNPLKAHDAAFSFHRLIILNKAPAFILAQFGFTPENVKSKIRAVDDYTLVMEIDKIYPPDFLLHCLSSSAVSVVDMKKVMENEESGDMGNNWLKIHYAGSGPFKLRQWKANEILYFDNNELYWNGPSKIKKIIIRHIAEPATQKMLIEQGDIDIARNLRSDQIKALKNTPDIDIQSAVKGSLFYMGLNQKHKILKIPQIQQAIKYLVEYEKIASGILNGKIAVHQSFVPKGFSGSFDDIVFKFNLKKAKLLLAEAGYKDGFEITIDVRNNFQNLSIAKAVQSSFAQAGIKAEINAMDSRQLLDRYYDRKHEIYIGSWGSGCQDLYTNANAFVWNPDNSDQSLIKSPAWSNAWYLPEINQKIQTALQEQDPEKQVQMYIELQKEHQLTAPFVIMFQNIEVAVKRDNVKGFILGPNVESNFYKNITK